MSTDFPTAAVGSSQAPTATVEKSTQRLKHKNSDSPGAPGDRRIHRLLQYRAPTFFVGQHHTGRVRAALARRVKLNNQGIVAMSGTALPTAGRFRFVASDRTGRPWITLLVLRGVHQTGTGSRSSTKQRAFGKSHIPVNVRLLLPPRRRQEISDLINCYAVPYSADIPPAPGFSDCASGGLACFTGATIPDPRAPFPPFSSPAP